MLRGTAGEARGRRARYGNSVPRFLVYALAAARSEDNSRCAEIETFAGRSVKRPDEVSANWRIGTPAPCQHGCDTLIVEIAAHLWPTYDLWEPVAVEEMPEGEQ